MKYLYGASVNGIQEFIFATNKLREIVGASEIVKNIANEFEKSIKNKRVKVILNAAGNIKAVFEREDELQEFIKEFSKTIFQKAYGITLSQAVVSFEGDEKEYLSTLEKRLRIQRNKKQTPIDLNFSIAKLAPTTSKMAVDIKDDTLIDKATKQKLDTYSIWFKKAQKENLKLKDFKDNSVLSNKKNKIAIIHIDGNGLGDLIPRLKKDFNLELTKFSKFLDEATKKAYKKASENREVRDIILGGDDVTVICNANDALEFTKEFLKEFENNTSDIFNGRNKLTAAAGIAYCNEKYPFHYAVSLSEELVKTAKNRSNRKKSCLMFHNVQSSYFESFDEYIENELTINDIRLGFGPYYTDNSPKIDDFINVVNGFMQKGSPISRLREWLKEISMSEEYSEFILNRIEQITRKKGIWDIDIMNNSLKKLNQNLSMNNLIIEIDGVRKTPIYDVLTILSVVDRSINEI